jgi:hypothetical protein
MEVAEKELSQYEIDLVSTLAWQAFKAEIAH